MARYLKALIGKDGSFMAIITDGLSAVKTMAEIHNTTPSASCAAGRLVLGTKLMELAMKDEGSRLSIEIRADGEIEKMLAYADKNGHLKLKIRNPKPETKITQSGKVDVAAAVGKEGSIMVTKDSLKTKPFTGTAKLISGEIAEDLAYYYMVSEQQATAISLGVFISDTGSVQCAGGLMLHVLPGADEEEITKIEKCMYEAKPITAYLRESEDLNSILKSIFGSEDIKIIEEGTYEYACDCSRDRAMRVFASISEIEKKRIMESDGKISLHCDFCHSDYEFTDEDFM